MNEPVIQTVLERIPSAELGVTLPHEHFFVTSVTANLQAPADARDWELAKAPVSLEIRDWLEFNWHSNRDNLVLDDADTAFDEAHRYRLAGGRSVIDVTPVGIGRDPLRLAALSRKTGLHIVMGSGYYVATTHPAELATMQTSEITDRIVAEFADGVGATGVRPGVIGEIGCSWPLLDVEEKVLQAAGAAQKILGAALYVHPGKHPDAPFQILKILETTGADPCRIIICHIERTVQEVGRIADLLRSGCTIEYDLFGMETTGFYYRSLGIDMLSDAQRLNQLRDLIASGFIHQLIISHDICFKHRLHRYGGHGYNHILTNILPWMRQRGFSAAEIETIVTDNPRRLVELAVRT
jgi:phosphotriesterase-related protein